MISRINIELVLNFYIAMSLGYWTLKGIIFSVIDFSSGFAVIAFSAEFSVIDSSKGSSLIGSSLVSPVIGSSLGW